MIDKAQITQSVMSSNMTTMDKSKINYLIGYLDSILKTRKFVEICLNNEISANNSSLFKLV